MNYIYKLLDKNGDILYIGKTNDLKRRLTEHIVNQEWSNEIEKMYYAICRDDFEQRTYENYYIIKCNPKYNKQDKSFKTHIELTDVEWKEFEDVEQFDKDKEIQERILFLVHNWTLVTDILDLASDIVYDVTDVRDIDICDIYTLQIHLEELDKRRRK